MTKDSTVPHDRDVTPDPSRTFQVDLRGLVDLLSRHLYASPRVYVRELLQNAADAITARREIDPGAPARVLIDPDPDTGGLKVHDTGIGLTEKQVHELLATIGRSSKRDELGFARHEFLGQFGIGLLSCFLVADEIRVETRHADEPTVLWTGYSDGRYSVSLADYARAESGTTVTLVPRRDAEAWLTPAKVAELARFYGSLLPIEVRVGPTRVTDDAPPWQQADRREALIAYCRETFDFTPFDVVELDVPAAGIRGAAFILPQPANPAARAGHRVYLKRMLLSEGVEKLLPEWAFFARCVVDTAELHPTASREALYEDTQLDEARSALGAQLRAWLVRLASVDPSRLAEFLGIHHLGVKALALHDDEMLRLVEQWWPMETNTGRMTLAEFRERHGLLRYAATLDEFRQLSAVAAAQGVPVINGGYTFDAEIIQRIPTLDRMAIIEQLVPTDLATRFDAVDPHIELSLRDFLSAAQRAVDPQGCQVVLRAFDPPTLPAMYLIDRDIAFADNLRETREKADDLWAGVLDALAATVTDDRPQLVLNHRNPLVRRMTTVSDPHLVALAVQALYGQALLLGHHPLRPADSALLNGSFLGLLERAVPDGKDDPK
ncbi:molecular chaperone HtpG [Virgisporangium aliadipatigenens]|uniref:Molecular chaperone HtpG n=1 Tax=Virgisporangium aliadipatigenens TaxID=741659 RepID=A0A8J3YKN2_9ACTN|nr:HSP90 family protein [Virgisporangium aliadipatigenens]GIJ47189.1 molecular chaperone HtpG [Virgisporangium aliadipatigenens]